MKKMALILHVVWSSTTSKMATSSLRRDFSISLHLQEKASPGDIFNMLETYVKPEEVECLQHLTESKWCVTVKNSFCRRTLMSSTLTIKNNPVAAGYPDGSATFVNVFNAPHELADAAVITKLSQFGRGAWLPPWTLALEEWGGERYKTLADGPHICDPLVRKNWIFPIIRPVRGADQDLPQMWGVRPPSRSM